MRPIPLPLVSPHPDQPKGAGSRFILLSTCEGGPWGALQASCWLIKWACALIWCLSLGVEGAGAPGIRHDGLEVLDPGDLLASLSQIPTREDWLHQAFTDSLPGARSLLGEGNRPPYPCGRGGQGGGGALGARITTNWESGIAGIGWIALFIYFWLCWVFVVT